MAAFEVVAPGSTCARYATAIIQVPNAMSGKQHEDSWNLKLHFCFRICMVTYHLYVLVNHTTAFNYWITLWCIQVLSFETGSNSKQASPRLTATSGQPHMALYGLLNAVKAIFDPTGIFKWEGLHVACDAGPIRRVPYAPWINVHEMPWNLKPHFCFRICMVTS